MGQFSSPFQTEQMSSREQKKPKRTQNLAEGVTIPSNSQCQEEKCKVVAAEKCIPCNKEFCWFHIKVANHNHKRSPSSRICEFEGCKKRLRITAFPCHCGKVFCALHTPAEMHGCGFDYLNHHKRKLEKDLEKVVGDKVPKM